MKIKYCVDQLSQIRRHWYDIIKLVTIRGFNDNLNRLKFLSKQEAVCVYAYDEESKKVLGVVIFTCILDNSEYTRNKLQELNIHHKETMQNGLIFVDQNYTRLGIATNLFDIRNRVGYDMGFRYVITTHFEGAAGRDWQAKKLKTHYLDENIIIVKLQEGSIKNGTITNNPSTYSR